MSNLLNKPLKAFTAFACVILACSIPAYFFLIESIWIDELDDHNQAIKAQIQTNFSGLGAEELDQSILLWNRVQAGSHISAVQVMQKDSVYIIEKMITDHGDNEMERFRGLLSGLHLNGNDYKVSIETNVEEVNETVLAISLITCFFMALLIIGFVLLNRYLSKKIWRPFTDTLEKLKRFDLNHSKKIDFEKTDIREFIELNKVLDKLIANNIRVFRQQKEFAENASHELQTPLALLKSKIDLLIQDAGLSAAQRQIIESLDASVSRVSRINKNLLLLAGIEHKTYTTEEFDLSEQVQSLVDVFSGFIESSSCSFTSSIEPGMILAANESLSEILLSNLFSNALRYTADGGAISVTLKNKALLITNTGSGALNSDHLFRRFGSVNAQDPGTGLGLAIVKEVCDKYGWRISYGYVEGSHSFSVVF